MGKAYRDDDMDDADDIAMESAVQELAASDISDSLIRRDDAADARTVTSRCRIRDQLNSDIDAYLASGGAIHLADEYMMPGSPGSAHSGHHGSGLH